MDNKDLQRVEKANVLCCPHLQDVERDRMGFPRKWTGDAPIKLVGQRNYLVLCEDCRDKLELTFMRDWVKPRSINDLPAVQRVRSLPKITD